ncbi:sortase-dependent protein [Kitasatospora sp. NPDC088134]|uniref:sortase-dependent protein n=1 Tax=Kitasatospora sp. NPDC088134 TaxID=3364071 RepID=UPI003807960B
MPGTTSVRRAVRLALVSAGVAGALALPTTAAFADGTPSPTAPAAVATPSAAPSPAATSATGRDVAPTPGTDPKSGIQVTAVPRGGAQTGEGTASSSLPLVLGTGLAAAGAAGLGLVVLRRRAGSRA